MTKLETLVSKEDLLEEYNSGMSTCKLANKYGVTSTAVSCLLKKNPNYVARSNKINSKKYHCNDSYFESIDTQEKAYWLGFMSADGYVSNSKNGQKVVAMTLNPIDRGHIEKFRTAIDSNVPIHDYVYHGFTTTNGSRIMITSNKMFEDLVCHGVVEHKSNVLMPPSIEKEYYSSWILGYFDGNGSLWRQRNGGRNPQWNLSITSTDSVLNFILDVFEENNLLVHRPKLCKRKPEHIVSNFKIGGNILVPRIMDFLYSNISANIPLDRKYQKYLDCKTEILNSRSA